LNLVGCTVGIVNANVGIDGAVVGKYEDPTGCDGGKLNIEKITKPNRRKPLIVEKPKTVMDLVQLAMVAFSCQQ